MSRSCPCSRWLRRAVTEPAFVLQPMVVQHVWLRLVAYASASESPGLFRFPGSVSASLSRLLSLTETEAETALAALAAMGWLSVDEDGHGLALIGARDDVARRESARSNGLRGGRPRKGETPEEARARRGQGALLLPLAGGRETQKTETEPERESSRVASSALPKEEKQQAARAPEGWVSLADELAGIAGFDPVHGGWSAAPVRGWLDSGATPELLRRVVADVAARPGYAERRVRSFQYFAAAIRDALDAAPAAPREPGEKCWGERFMDWVNGGRVGPEPMRERAA